MSQTTATAATATNNDVPTLSSTVNTQIIDADDEMEFLTLDSTDTFNIPDFLSNNVHSDIPSHQASIRSPTNHQQPGGQLPPSRLPRAISPTGS